jgi:hypothetical protein
MKHSSNTEEELQESEVLLVQHVKTRKQPQDRYCPVITYDGITKNPEYKQRPMRHY